MKKEAILKEIASYKKERDKILKHFKAIVAKNDNDLEIQERIDVLLDLIKIFQNRIDELEQMIQ
jgi:uncharacterized coiled-coil DUF342 family protein